MWHCAPSANVYLFRNATFKYLWICKWFWLFFKGHVVNMFLFIYFFVSAQHHAHKWPGIQESDPEGVWNQSGMVFRPLPWCSGKDSSSQSSECEASSLPSRLSLLWAHSSPGKWKRKTKISIRFCVVLIPRNLKKTISKSEGKICFNCVKSISKKNSFVLL